MLVNICTETNNHRNTKLRLNYIAQALHIFDQIYIITATSINAS